MNIMINLFYLKYNVNEIKIIKRKRNLYGAFIIGKISMVILFLTLKHIFYNCLI